MRYNKQQTLAIILALVASLVVSHLAFAEDLTAIDLEATAKLGPEIAKLQKQWPLEDEVEIRVIKKNVQAWTGKCSTPYYLNIIDCGHKENVKALRHEWRHRFDQQNLIFGDESERNARKAETP